MSQRHLWRHMGVDVRADTMACIKSFSALIWRGFLVVLVRKNEPAIFVTSYGRRCPSWYHGSWFPLTFLAHSFDEFFSTLRKPIRLTASRLVSRQAVWPSVTDKHYESCTRQILLNRACTVELLFVSFKTNKTWSFQRKLMTHILEPSFCFCIQVYSCMVVQQNFDNLNFFHGLMYLVSNKELFNIMIRLYLFD